MSTVTEEKISTNDIDNDDDDMLEHICSPQNKDISLCGEDISNEPWNHGGPPCAACHYIAGAGPGSMN